MTGLPTANLRDRERGRKGRVTRKNRPRICAVLKGDALIPPTHLVDLDTRLADDHRTGGAIHRHSTLNPVPLMETGGLIRRHRTADSTFKAKELT